MAHPKDLATWLTITLNQRKRQAVAMTKQFGPSSPATLAVEAECAQIQEAITEYTKAAAAAPLKK